MQHDPLQVAADGARARLATYLTEADPHAGDGWLWAGYLAGTLRSLLQAIPVQLVDVDPALVNDAVDAGLCNLATPDGPCQAGAGHPHYAGVVAPGRCVSCGATVDQAGDVHEPALDVVS